MSLQKLKALSPVQQRKAAAILGAIIADAASAPLHWIYDQSKVESLTSGGTVEYYPESKCPYYIIPTGENSAYGSQVSATLDSVVASKGFKAESLADELFKVFGPGTIYEKVRQSSDSPKQGPWTNHNLKIFIANREANRTPAADPTSQDPDGLCKSVVVVGQYSGKPDVLDQVAACVATTQSNPAAIDFAKSGAALLDSIIQTGELSFDAAEKAATPAVAEALKAGLDAKDTPHKQAAASFGLACGFPASFKGMIQGIASATGYSQAVRDGILAAGDNCSRNTFIGACVAARFGLDSIPEDWLKKYNHTEQVLAQIEAVVTL